MESHLARVAIVLLVLSETAGGFTLRRLGDSLDLGLLGMARLWLVVALLVIVVALRTRYPGPIRRAIPVGVGVAFLHALLVLSLWWSPSRLPDAEEVAGVVFLMVSAPVVALLFSRDPRTLHRWFLKLLWVFGIAALPVAILAFSDVAAELNLRAVGSIRIARTAGLAAVAALALSTTGDGWRRLWPVPLWILVMLASGNRASILAFMVGALPSLMALRALKLITGTAILAIAASVVLITVPLAGEIVRFFAFEALWDSSGRLYLADRGTLFSSAVMMFNSAPIIGHGLRGYAELAGNYYDYPHNLTLGFASELGLLGLVPYGILVSQVVIVLWGCRDPLQLGLGGVFLFLLTSAQFTGSYGDAFLLWATLIALVAGRATDPTRAPG